MYCCTHTVILSVLLRDVGGIAAVKGAIGIVVLIIPHLDSCCYEDLKQGRNNETHKVHFRCVLLLRLLRAAFDGHRSASAGSCKLRPKRSGLLYGLGSGIIGGTITPSGALR